jgi:hypothetical protein
MMERRHHGAGATIWGRLPHSIPHVTHSRPSASGLLHETLIVWTREFGRTPEDHAEDSRGRKHHHQVFTPWMVGGSFRLGGVYGASADGGDAVAGDRAHVHEGSSHDPASARA